MADFELRLDDMEVKVVRTYRLSEPTRVEIGLQSVRATFLQVTETTYSTGTSETKYQVRGRELKTNGTVDERKQAYWFTMHRPSTEFTDTPSDPREPFIEALHALADEKGL